jgi:hypothetical protein
MSQARLEQGAWTGAVLVIIHACCHWAAQWNGASLSLRGASEVVMNSVYYLSNLLFIISGLCKDLIQPHWALTPLCCLLFLGWTYLLTQTMWIKWMLGTGSIFKCTAFWLSFFLFLKMPEPEYTWPHAKAPDEVAQLSSLIDLGLVRSGQLQGHLQALQFLYIPKPSASSH